MWHRPDAVRGCHHPGDDLLGEELVGVEYCQHGTEESILHVEGERHHANA